MNLGLYTKNDWHRLVSENSSERLKVERYRDDVRRDYARLIHSPAFRRLQGKTQLFPGQESDFFRNRLTHSIEVAQIAKSIAIRLNKTEPALAKKVINTDLVEFAALAHDIGHPPFGHNGEHALDQLMMNNGGFEGNAQTLRLLSRIEKKITTNFPAKTSRPVPVDPLTHIDLRAGLNPTVRSLAAILKYDEVIPSNRKARDSAKTDKKAHKGYYELESEIVSVIKSKVGHDPREKFKTIECQIMDIADDIAYSTYDLEDSFKADFLSPLMMISMSDEFKNRLAEKVKENIDKSYKDKTASERDFSVQDINNILAEIFSDLLTPEDGVADRLYSGVSLEEGAFILSSMSYGSSKELGRNGYLRTSFTSYLVGRWIRNVEFEYDAVHPSQSTVRLSLETFKVVETLKHFSFQLLIESPRLKLAEKRGSEIINKIFETLKSDHSLLPDDWRAICNAHTSSSQQERTICDYIAGMTDVYCIELHSRITGTNPPSLWKPH